MLRGVVSKNVQSRAQLDFVHFQSSPGPEYAFICDEFECFVEREDDTAHVPYVLPPASV